jgi:hypothetical protein
MTVRRVEVGDATDSLATYIRDGAAGPVVVTEEGRPVAALVMLEDADFETIALSTDPDFLKLIEDSRARQAEEGGLSSDEMRRRLEGEVVSPRRRMASSNAARETSMSKGLDGRSRDKDGTIHRKRSDTTVGTLRETYGPEFAKEFRSDAQLGTVLKRTGAKSLDDYRKRKS